MGPYKSDSFVSEPAVRMDRHVIYIGIDPNLLLSGSLDIETIFGQNSFLAFNLEPGVSNGNSLLPSLHDEEVETEHEQSILDEPNIMKMEDQIPRQSVNKKAFKRRQSGSEEKGPYKKVKTLKEDLNDSSETENDDSDNILKSDDEEDASVKLEDPTKREEVEDNIKMEIPDEIAMDMAKINFKKKVNTVEVCHVCAKEFWGRPSLLQHLKKHEGIVHQCDKCSYKSSSGKYLKDHISRTHSGITFQCHQCERSFTEKSRLRKHTRFVHDMIQFLCDRCTFKGKTQGDLKKHILWIHEGKGPQCELCDYKPTQKSAMARHMALIHGNGQPTKYKDPISMCIECGETYATKVGLDKHMMVHTGEKPFSCEQCGKAFSQKVVLQQHMRTHTGEKPYSCQNCEKAFSISSALRRHALKDHNVVIRNRSEIRKGL